MVVENLLYRVEFVELIITYLCFLFCFSPLMLPWGIYLTDKTAWVLTVELLFLFFWCVCVCVHVINTRKWVSWANLILYKQQRIQRKPYNLLAIWKRLLAIKFADIALAAIFGRRILGRPQIINKEPIGFKSRLLSSQLHVVLGGGTL